MTVAPYGSWVSPITSDSVSASAVRLGAIALDGQDTYWLEGRPTEGGRNVLVRRAPDGSIADVSPAPFNVRTRVHEYGGGAFAIADGIVYFVNFADQRLYRQPLGGEPTPLTAEGQLRYADLLVDRARGRIVCVLEDHGAGGPEPTNSLGAVSLRDGSVAVLASGYDFYSSPVLSPDGDRLAWQCWRHPNMPWDQSEIWAADIGSDGSLADARKVAGEPGESVFQPEWSPDGMLYFVSDRSGWWNLYRHGDGDDQLVVALEAELGQPQWAFGEKTYGFDSAADIVCYYDQAGRSRLAKIDVREATVTPIETPYSDVTNIRVETGVALFLGAAPTLGRAVIRLDLRSGAVEVLKRASETTIDPGYVSEPRSIEFPTEGGLTAHGIFYPPRNKDYQGPPGERPPLLVLSHGGPTGASSTGFSSSIQFWTSRGIAVLDVNYGGSTGYGRDYRRRLNGNWGVVDVDDCVNGAKYLVAQGEVDPNRLAIRGGSAGGYTTLAALAFRDVFKAGASYYGVSDLEALAKDTHKFEARYLDSMIGPYPERRDLYVERSPIHHVDRLSAPTIFFQGLEDKVVPPDQAERMVEALRAKGVEVAYVPFEGEQHGFRRAENIKRSLDEELAFYARVFQFGLPELARV